MRTKIVALTIVSSLLLILISCQLDATPQNSGDGSLLENSNLWLSTDGQPVSWLDSSTHFSTDSIISSGSGDETSLDNNASIDATISSSSTKQSSAASNGSSGVYSSIFVSSSAGSTIISDPDDPPVEIIEENGGPIVGCGEWIYYCAEIRSRTKHYLYKIRKDGTGKKILCATESVFLYIEGDWVYGASDVDSWDSKNIIYRIKKDGSEQTTIYRGNSYSFIVENDWIFFIDGEGLKRINTDGSNLIMINPEANNMRIVNGLKYTNYHIMVNGTGEEIYKVYRYSADGLYKEEVPLDIFFDATERSNKIFYYAKSFESENEINICRTNLDFSGRVVLDSSNTVQDFTVSDKYCFYLKNVNRQSFYRLNSADGSDKQQINVIIPDRPNLTQDSEISSIRAIGDWVYLKILSYWYRCKPDGTSMEVLDW